MLAAGALLAAQRQAWLWAGACGFLAGLTLADILWTSETITATVELA